MMIDSILVDYSCIQLINFAISAYYIMSYFVNNRWNFDYAGLAGYLSGYIPN